MKDASGLKFAFENLAVSVVWANKDATSHPSNSTHRTTTQAEIQVLLNFAGERLGSGADFRAFELCKNLGCAFP
jgi:hypothetical protein